MSPVPHRTRLSGRAHIACPSQAETGPFRLDGVFTEAAGGALTFHPDVLACPHCRGRLRLIATLHDAAVIRKLLAPLGMARSGARPGPAPPAPGAVALRCDSRRRDGRRRAGAARRCPC